MLNSAKADGSRGRSPSKKPTPFPQLEGERPVSRKHDAVVAPRNIFAFGMPLAYIWAGCHPKEGPESVTGFYVVKIMCVQKTIYGILKYHQKHTALFGGKDRPAGEAMMPHLLGCEGFAVYLYSFILRAACLRETQASASAAY